MGYLHITMIAEPPRLFRPRPIVVPRRMRMRDRMRQPSLNMAIGDTMLSSAGNRQLSPAGDIALSDGTDSCGSGGTPCCTCGEGGTFTAPLSSCSLIVTGGTLGGSYSLPLISAGPHLIQFEYTSGAFDALVYVYCGEGIACGVGSYFLGYAISVSSTGCALSFNCSASPSPAYAGSGTYTVPATGFCPFPTAITGSFTMILA
jgi:hypothetical protein